MTLKHAHKYHVIQCFPILLFICMYVWGLFTGYVRCQESLWKHPLLIPKNKVHSDYWVYAFLAYCIWSLECNVCKKLSPDPIWKKIKYQQALTYESWKSNHQLVLHRHYFLWLWVWLRNWKQKSRSIIKMCHLTLQKINMEYIYFFARYGKKFLPVMRSVWEVHYGLHQDTSRLISFWIF